MSNYASAGFGHPRTEPRAMPALGSESRDRCLEALCIEAAVWTMTSDHRHPVSWYCARHHARRVVERPDYFLEVQP